MITNFNNFVTCKEETLDKVFLLNGIEKSDAFQTLAPMAVQNTPKTIFYITEWKRALGLTLDHFQFDLQATYSVTAGSIAKLRDLDILQTRHKIPRDITILDGMACVGGDTTSFMTHFPHGELISNEIDYRRYQFLQDNIKEVIQELRAQKRPYLLPQILHGNVLDLFQNPLFETVDMLYLDPEWGGESFRVSKTISISIHNTPLETVIQNAFNASKRLRWIVLKLPPNLDRAQLKHHNVQVSIYHILKRFTAKMSFVILERNVEQPTWTETDIELEKNRKRKAGKRS